MPAHKVLRERLGALQLRRPPAWAETRDADGAQRVTDAVHQRLLGPNDDQVDLDSGSAYTAQIARRSH